MATLANSPASSGPSGSHFEGQVGAHYLLTMLAGAQPRGLPGTTIDRVEFQRAGENYPLDDVIVHAHDAKGANAVLEIQVKRSISFTPTDSVFKSVVNQIAKAACKPDFDSINYELAIATAKTSKKIDGAYQEVLTWARQLGDSSTFFKRLKRQGSANEDMRTFVNSFRSNLSSAGANDDDETVWKLLTRLQILIFDFTVEGSSSEALANERAIHILHPDDVARAQDLWSSLIELSIRIAACGGYRDKETLISDLTLHSFRFSGERNHVIARQAIGEASQLALADIKDQIGEVKLTRYERVNAVNNSLDKGRYVEIRGDAGVGKSAILKHFAEQVGEEAIPIVFSSNRTTPRGWIAMRSEIGFNGTAREFLTDFAATGGGIIFIDGLDFFSQVEKVTIIDLVREAAQVPGISVIVTMRREFGVEEQNWLPFDSLTTLGIAPPVIIEELSEKEIEELSAAAPSLAPLLTHTHPARDVARNLFRLSRLAMQSSNAHLLLTEVEMAHQWWKSADGSKDDCHRERARALKIISQQALSEIDPIDVSELPASSINSLIASGTLLDLHNDKVTFRHDVLREWAIACLIETNLSTLQSLPLHHLASPTFARAIELLSRILVEQGSDLTEWQSLLSIMSGNKTHGSWRRSVLLALVRAENAQKLLTKTSNLLFFEKAKLLRELIWLEMAIDVMPASKALATAGIETSVFPENFNVPSDPSWMRLIIWLHEIQDHLPKIAIPDVLEMYIKWSLGTFGSDSLTPTLVKDIYKWLIKSEETHKILIDRYFRQPFDDELLRPDQVKAHETNLRQGFLLFCNHTPDLAAQYINKLKENNRSDTAVRDVLITCGTIAQAAPQELAELTLMTLIPEENSEGHYYANEYNPFHHFDLEFFPASPAQGPFLKLLTHAPEHGKALIYKLVEHTILFYSNMRDYGEDAITIVFPDGERIFPWIRSYAWAREGSRHNSVTSGLMALEGWAHQRIESGESFDKVLSEVLGPPGSPCCYLLIAVDLILSHLSKSREAAIPFLACPKLLCIDRERAFHDRYKIPDLLGVRHLQKEPKNVINIESLRNRPSRRKRLDEILVAYVFNEPTQHREKLSNMLHTASNCLGLPSEDSDLKDPSLMSVYALNVLKPENYKKNKITLKDGTKKEVYQYVSPEEERKHFGTLNKFDEAEKTDTSMQLILSKVVEDPSSSSSELAAAAVEWADKTVEEFKRDDPDSSMREQAIVTAAMVVIRDGDSELRNKRADWAHKIFIDALDTEEDPVHRFRPGMRYNISAIAFVGMAYGLCQGVPGFEIRDILKAASTGNPASAHGLGHTASILVSRDERLIPALLRIAIKTCLKTDLKWDVSDTERENNRLNQKAKAEAVLNAELAWLANSTPEPEWPAIPSHELHLRRGIRIPGKHTIEDIPDSHKVNHDEHFDHQAAALWLSNLHHIAVSGSYPWINTIINQYNTWTSEANGLGLDTNQAVTNEPSEWNDAYYYLLALTVRKLGQDKVDELALNQIISLPDKSFLNVVTIFLRNVDDLFFNNDMFNDDSVKHIRSRLADRIVCTKPWRYMSGSRRFSIEINLAPAIATLLFNDYDMSSGSKCYLFEKGIERAAPFLETVQKLAQEGPSLFTAKATLNLFEVSPKDTHLPLIINIAKAWCESFNDFREFWVDYGIGQRFCKLIEIILSQDNKALSNSKELQVEMDFIIPRLISLGVPEARRLEEVI